MKMRGFIICIVLSVLLLCSLAQASTAACPIKFDVLDFGSFTSVCKPDSTTSEYPAQACCSSLESLVCPLEELLSDEKNDCAATFLIALDKAYPFDLGVVGDLCFAPESPYALSCLASAPAPAPVSG
ncbi:hypothetical protein Mapa_001646 [Marchantia paleacea]|nr:hypothetical protein Mapa_001646 [Marchantia paleacea]